MQQEKDTLAKKGYFGNPDSGVVCRRCRRGRGAVRWCRMVPKDGGTKREEQTERLMVLGWVNGKPDLRRDCETAGGGCASETRGTCLSEM